MAQDVSIQLKDERWKALLKPYRKTVQTACKAALAGAGMRKSYELSIVLADDAFIRQLNRDYRGKNKPTNVLSFAGEGKHLGDLVLALDSVLREAKAQKKTPKHHATHLLVHGVLHLLHFDHDDEENAGRMEALEIKILKKLGVNNPYL